MALTKVTGHVVKTDTNLHTHNINSSGIVTAISLDISGNVSVGGTLTYQDVTNVDSVGIITARAGIIDSTLTSGRVTYAGSGGRLTDSANLTFSGSDLTVGGKVSCDVNSDISMSSSAAGQLVVGGDGYTSAIALDGDAMHIYHNSSSRGLVLGTNETERLRITGAGKVGIGTDDPDHNLHLWKYGGDSVLSIESQGDGNHSAIEFLRTSSGGDSKGAGSIYVTGDTGASEAKMQFGVGHNISHGQLPRMTIMGNGEVGIGTDNPLCGDLQVGATAGGTLGSVFTSTPLVAIAPGNLGGTQFDDHKIAIFGGQTTGNCSGLSFYHYRRNTGTNWTTDGFSLRQEVDNTSNIYDYMNFAGGKVGIGTNIPVSALDVRNNSGTDPLLSLHHSNADVIGEVIRIGRVTPYHTIRYHSIKAEHSGGAASNMLSFSLHNGSTVTSQSEVLRLQGDEEVQMTGRHHMARKGVAPSSFTTCKETFKEESVADGASHDFQTASTYGGGLVTITSCRDGNATYSRTQVYLIAMRATATSGVTPTVFNNAGGASGDSSFTVAGCSKGITVTNNSGYAADIFVTFDIQGFVG